MNRKYLINLGAVLLIKFFKLIGPVWRIRIAKAATHCALGFSASTRKRALTNVANCLPGLTEKEIRSVAYESYKNICLGIVDSFRMENLELDIQADTFAQAVLASKNGAIIATMHMSCYEAVSLALQRLTGRSTTLSKIPEYLAIGFKTYQKAGIQCVHKKDKGAFLKLIQAAREGQFITLHSDHYAKETDVTFFQQPTQGPCGAAMLSALAGKPLLVGWATLLPSGHYRVVFETVTETPVSRDQEEIRQTMQLVLNKFEAVIRQYPDQWYWSYNRWRQKSLRKSTNAAVLQREPA